MTRSLLPTLLVVAALAAACTGQPAAPVATPIGTSSDAPTGTPTDAPVVEPVVASYAPGAPAVDLPGGWTIRDCEGDAPLVCVGRADVPDGDVVGTLMLDSFPLDAGLAAADGREAVLEALRANAQLRMQGLVDDRVIGCGAAHEGSIDPMVDLLVDGRAGVRSGFRAVQDGEVVEHVVTYATVAAGQLWLLVAESARDGSCMDDAEMDLFTPDRLATFVPVLDRLVAGTPLPAAGRRIEEGTVLGVDEGSAGGGVHVFVHGELHRVQEPRPMAPEDLEREGVAIGAPVVHVALADTTTGSWFAVVPATGPDARLHLVVDGVAHPVVVQQVDTTALDGVPETATPDLDRLLAVTG